MSCPICLEDGVDYITDCHHKYHDKCIKQWMKKNNTCPICREIINEEFLEYWSRFIKNMLEAPDYDITWLAF